MQVVDRLERQGFVSQVAELERRQGNLPKNESSYRFESCSDIYNVYLHFTYLTVIITVIYQIIKLFEVLEGKKNTFSIEINILSLSLTIRTIDCVMRDGPEPPRPMATDTRVCHGVARLPSAGSIPVSIASWVFQIQEERFGKRRMSIQTMVRIHALH